MIFWTKFAEKRHFQSKTDKMNNTTEYCMFELVFVSNFTLNKQFWIFGQNLPKKDIYAQKQKKWRSWLKSAYFSLGTKFLLKLTILIFWNKFVQKPYFQSKAEKVSTIIEFCIFELVYNLRKTLAFMSNSRLGERFNFCFSGSFY